MSWVKAKPGETFESLMRRFKKAVERSGILSDLRKYEYYEKPSIARKRKQAAARKRAAKKEKQVARARDQKGSNESFKWSKDKTKKIPMPPPSKRYPPKQDNKKVVRPNTNPTKTYPRTKE